MESLYLEYHLPTNHSICLDCSCNYIPSCSTYLVGIRQD